MRPFVIPFLFVSLGVSALACEDLNRPMPVPHSEPRRGCFTDVECASSMKCAKGPQDIQGICEPRDGTAAPDAGAGAHAPARHAGDAGPHAPAPGDLQL